MTAAASNTPIPGRHSGNLEVGGRAWKSPMVASVAQSQQLSSTIRPPRFLTSTSRSARLLLLVVPHKRPPAPHSSACPLVLVLVDQSHRPSSCNNLDVSLDAGYVCCGTSTAPIVSPPLLRFVACLSPLASAGAEVVTNVGPLHQHHTIPDLRYLRPTRSIAGFFSSASPSRLLTREALNQRSRCALEHCNFFA